MLQCTREKSEQFLAKKVRLEKKKSEQAKLQQKVAQRVVSHSADAS